MPADEPERARAGGELPDGSRDQLASGSGDSSAAGASRAGTAAASAEGVLVARTLRKSYLSGDGSELVVLDGVGIDVQAAEVVAVIGASGAGKSTLLHLLGGLDRPTAGAVLLDGVGLETLDDAELADVRNRKLGFVFQFHHLLREFTALENAMMPLLIEGVAKPEATSRARELLESVGLGGRLDHKPAQLSGGEQQRVAVARALANEPAVVLADEPSGNLDTDTSERLHDLFFRLRDERGVAMVMATHNRELADRADRVMRLQKGHLEDLYRA